MLHNNDSHGSTPQRHLSSPASLSSPYTDVARRSTDIRRSYYKQGSWNQQSLAPPTSSMRPHQLPSSLDPSTLIGHSLIQEGGGGIGNKSCTPHRSRRRGKSKKVPAESFPPPPQICKPEPIFTCQGEENSVVSGWSQQQLLKKRAKRDRKKKLFPGPSSSNVSKASKASSGSSKGSPVFRATDSNGGNAKSWTKIKSLIRKKPTASLRGFQTEMDASFDAAVSHNSVKEATFEALVTRQRSRLDSLSQGVSSRESSLTRQEAAGIQEQAQWFHAEDNGRTEQQSQISNGPKSSRGRNSRVFFSDPLRTVNERNKVEDLFATDQNLAAYKSTDPFEYDNKQTFPPVGQGARDTSFHVNNNDDMSLTTDAWFNRLPLESASTSFTASQYPSTGFPTTSMQRNQQFGEQGVSAHSFRNKKDTPTLYEPSASSEHYPQFPTGHPSSAESLRSKPMAARGEPINRSSYLSRAPAVPKNSTPQRIAIGMYDAEETNKLNSTPEENRSRAAIFSDLSSPIEKIQQTGDGSSDSPTSVAAFDRAHTKTKNALEPTFESPPRIQSTAKPDDVPSDEEGSMMMEKNKNGFYFVESTDLSTTMSISEMTDPAIWASGQSPQKQAQREKKSSALPIMDVLNKKEKGPTESDAGQAVDTIDKYHSNERNQLMSSIDEHEQRVNSYPNSSLQDFLCNDTSESMEARNWLERRRKMERLGDDVRRDEQQQQCSDAKESAIDRVKWQQNQREETIEQVIEKRSKEEGKRIVSISDHQQVMDEVNLQNDSMGARMSPTCSDPSDMSVASSTWFSAEGSNKDFIEIVAAVVIQTAVRRYIASTFTRRRLYAVHVIQAAVCRWMAKREQCAIDGIAFQMYDLAAIRIQALFRGWWMRDSLKVDHYCATMIQRATRCYLGQTNYHYDLCRITIAQSVVRMFLAIKSSARHLVSILYIQAVYRGFKIRQRFAMERAATKIQSIWRYYDEHMNFMHNLADILIIQSIARRWLTLRLVQPYIQSKPMEGGKECVIFDDNSGERSKEEKSDHEELAESSVDSNALVKMWRRRNGQIEEPTSAPAPSTNQYALHTHPRRTRFR